MTVLQNIMGKAESARESISNATNVSPEQIKTAALGKIRGAYDTVRGSGSVGQELRKVGNAYINAPLEIVAAIPRAMGQLLTVQPWELTKTVFGTAANVAGNVAQACLAPIPLTIAAAQQSLGTAKKTGTALINAPVRAGRVVQNGCGRILDMLGSPMTPASPTTAKAPAIPPAPAGV